jgi:hypothetical protein
MKTSRMWFAALIFLAPWSTLMFIASAESDLSPTGPVSGRVTYNGRPLESGVIYFDPIEENSSDRCAGLIGKDGVYFIDAGWRRGQAKFRIAVLPALRKPSVASGSPGEGTSTRAKGVSAIPNAETRTLASVAFPIPQRYGDIRSSGLRVNLGREDARVDIDLKD